MTNRTEFVNWPKRVLARGSATWNEPVACTRAIRCPVCDGRGSVPVGFYDHGGFSTSTNSLECRACLGKGILWAP